MENTVNVGGLKNKEKDEFESNYLCKNLIFFSFGIMSDVKDFFDKKS